MPGEFAKALEWISIAEAALQWSREREDSPGVIEAVLYDYWERWCEEYGIDYDAEEWKFRDEARYADALFDLDDSWIDKPSADDILINRRTGRAIRRGGRGTTNISRRLFPLSGPDQLRAPARRPAQGRPAGVMR